MTSTGIILVAVLPSVTLAGLIILFGCLVMRKLDTLSYLSNAIAVLADRITAIEKRLTDFPWTSRAREERNDAE